MKTLFQRSDRDGGYDFLATSSYFLSMLDSRDAKIDMLVAYCLKPKRHRIIKRENREDCIRLSEDIDADSSRELYLKKETYRQIRNDLRAIIQDKPPYIMVLKISDTVFEIQALYKLSPDDLEIIKQFRIFYWIVRCILIFIFFYLVVWLEGWTLLFNS